MIVKEMFKAQMAQFRVFNTNARKLILANLLFGLFNPFYLIFSNTFIFSSTKGDLSFNLLYCVFTYIGILTGFITTGFIVRHIHVKKLLVLGAFIMFLAIMVMFLLPQGSLTGTWIFVFGIISGTGNGIYWASRNYLTVVNTHDGNRDFFSGIDFILISSGRIITPLLVGLYIGEGVKRGWFSHLFAYRSTLIFAFLLVLFIGIVILFRKYKTIKTHKFLYAKYSPIWNKTRLMIFYLGLFQGAFFALPPVLIMKFVGGETSVGTLSSIGYLIAIVIVYYISRRSGAEHRTGILKAGAWLFFLSALFFVAFIFVNSLIATSVFILVMFLTEPILGFPFRATFMKVIDDLKHKEKRDDYAYVTDIEVFAALGRVLSLVLFFVMYTLLPVNVSIPAYMVIIAAVQFLNIRLSRKINGK
jgi:YQGE family putative transporter